MLGTTGHINLDAGVGQQSGRNICVGVNRTMLPAYCIRACSSNPASDGVQILLILTLYLTFSSGLDTFRDYFLDHQKTCYMKKSICFSACFLLIGLCLLAQTPQAFKYQAVARNSTGSLIQNQGVAFRISILQGGPSGTLLYQESHAPTTNAFGLANLEIGKGTVLSGTFSTIDWSAGQVFMKVELDPSGGTTYQDMGTAELLSVPYSLFSERSGNNYWGKNGNSIYYAEGPVGIGTSNPSSNLDVRGNNPDDGAMIKVGNGDLSHFLMLSGGRMSDPNPMVFWKDGDPLRFVTDQGGGAEKMRIMPDGRMGLGTPSPDNSALLDMTSSSKGLLLPRMTQLERDAITNPANGLLIYQTDNTAGYYYNAGSSMSPLWTLLNSASVSGWSLTGNSGIDPAVNFLGTTDNKPLKFRVNNLKAGEINPVNDNTYLGRQAGENSSGSNNVAVGSFALQSNVANLRSTAIGYGAMSNADNTSTGVETYNTAVGCEALRGSNSPADNTGRRNTAVGDQALYSNSAGYHNTALGNQTLFSNTTGNYNTVVGLRALYTNKANSRSTAIGYQSMYYADDQSTGLETYNTAVGYEALKGSSTPANNTGQENTAIGDQSLYSNTTGSFNTAGGNQALFSNTSGWSNTAFGNQSLYFNIDGLGNTATGSSTLYNNKGSANTANGCSALFGNTTGEYNTAIGFAAIMSNSTGVENTAIGVNSMINNTSGNGNTAGGYQALYSNKANSRSTAIGYQSMYYADDQTTGQETYNTAIGYEALKGSTTAADNTGINNTALGDQALYSNSTGHSNTAVGGKALYSNTTGMYNTVSGHGALHDNTEGWSNTASGYHALYANTTASLNSAYGADALVLNTVGNSNTAIGTDALYSNIAGSEATAVGFGAMYNTNNTSSPFDNENVALGYLALFGSTDPSANTGFYNTALGTETLYNNSTGMDNTATGCRALSLNSTGNYNTANGSYAMASANVGSHNTAVGTHALSICSTADGNTAVGSLAGAHTDLGLNTCIGYSAGDVNFYLKGTFLGAWTCPALDGFSNCMALGYYAMVTASNRVVIGNTYVTSIGGYAGWTNFSDGRFKKNVSENVPGLSFIKLLRPVVYTLDVTSLNAQLNKNRKPTTEEREARPMPTADDFAGIAAKEKILYTGFVAQEVEAAAKSIGYDFSGVDAPQHENDYYGLRYAEFVVPLVKAVQELARENEDLKERISRLEKLIK
jgi:hypothetical protein